MVSPYIESVSGKLRDRLETAGIHVTSFASFDESQEEKVVRIAPGSIVSAARQVAAEGSIDAVFLSCTNLRTLDVIDVTEAQLELPVLASNQVLAWHMLCLAGQKAPGHLNSRLWQAVPAKI